jgi:hypothetical protein
MFTNDETIGLDVLATVAQVLPALLAIGLLVPILSGMKMGTPERLYYATNTGVVLLTEATLLWLLIDGNPAPGGLRYLLWGSCLYALIGVLGIALIYARSTPAEREAERAAYRRQRAERQEQAAGRKAKRGSKRGRSERDRDD